MIHPSHSKDALIGFLEREEQLYHTATGEIAELFAAVEKLTNEDMPAQSVFMSADPMGEFLKIRHFSPKSVALMLLCEIEVYRARAKEYQTRINELNARIAQL